MQVDVLQSEERSGARERGPGRRSKSEGPPGEPEYRVRYMSPRARRGGHNLRNMRSDSDPNNFDKDTASHQVVLTTYSNSPMCERAPPPPVTACDCEFAILNYLTIFKV